MSDDIFLYEEVPDSQRLAIIFSHRGARRFGAYKTLQNTKINRLFVRDPTNTWYNGPVQNGWEDADALLERLRAIIAGGLRWS